MVIKKTCKKFLIIFSSLIVLIRASLIVKAHIGPYLPKIIAHLLKTLNSFLIPLLLINLMTH